VEARDVARGKADRERGKGIRADGSVSLAEYVRRRDRDKIKSPVISTVNLSGKEFAHFGPSKAALGETWLVPDAVAKKFCRAASPMCYQHAPQPEWVKDINLKARVMKVEDGRATLAYEGKLSSERLWQNGKVLSAQELTLRGEGVYDLATKKIQSLLILGSGSFCWPEENPDKQIPFDALIEWESGTP
jgi:hypothetical protein